MKRTLLADMVCPYCLGGFGISRDACGDGERLRWGLVRCRFEFPIVDGVMLLSLAKGYGVSEEELQPYTPLLVASIEYLRRADVAGLRDYIARQFPLLDRLMSPTPLHYLTFMRDLNRRLWASIERDLAAWGRFEVLGRRGAWRRERTFKRAIAASPLGSWLLRARARLLPPLFGSFYVARFVGTDLRSYVHDV